LPPEEWTVERSAGLCATCARAFAPKDVRFSALYKEKAGLVRKDYCAACWGVAPRGAEIGFWRSVVPEPEELEEKKKRRADAALSTDTLFEILGETAGSSDPERLRFRFVVALLLMRRKKLKLVQLARRKVEGGQEEDVLVLARTGRGRFKPIEVVDVKMSEQDMLAAQDEVERLLTLSGPPPEEGAGAAGHGCETPGGPPDGGGTG